MVIPTRMAPEPSDAELARLIASTGDAATAAEDALFRRYAPRVELYGFKHLKDRVAAQDLAQQVMLHVLQAIRAGRVEDPDRLSSFIFGTCRHVSWDMRRADQRQRKIATESGHLESHDGPPDHSERDVVQLLGCLGALPEREALVVRMSFMEDRDTDEIAERLALTVGNVRVIRHRALAKLAGCLSQGRPS